MKLLKNIFFNIKNQINTSTLDEYLKLPEKQRTICKIFYRRPFAMQSGEWKKFETYVKQNFKIHYYLEEMVDSLKRWYKWYVRDSIYYLKCFFWHRYNIIKLDNDPRWKDSNYKVEKSLEKILNFSIEDEKVFEVIDFDHDEEHQQVKHQLTQCYDFFKFVLPTKQKQYDDLLRECFGGIGLMDLNKPVPPEIQAKRNTLNRLEQQIDQQITDHLILIVKLRDWMSW